MEGRYIVEQEFGYVFNLIFSKRGNVGEVKQSSSK